MTAYVNHEVFKRIEGIMSNDNMAFKAGKIWDSIDEQAVCEMYDRGLELLEICKQLGRTPLGILERLKKYGRVRPHAYEPNTWVRCIESTVNWNTNPYTTTTIATGTGISANAYTTSNTATINTPKESNIMTKPLEHKAFLFGNDITKLAEIQIIGYIKQANEEINSYASIPDNNYTKLRIANLKDAIEAAVKELNKRGD